jgi:hypothetical protein
VPYRIDIGSGILAVVALGLAAAAALAARSRSRWRMTLLLAVLPALLGTELALRARSVIPSRRAFAYPVSDGLRQLQEAGSGGPVRCLGLPRVREGGYAFHRSALLPFTNLPYGVDELRSFQPMAPPGYRDLLNALDPDLADRTGWLLAPYALRSPLLDLVSVTHLAAPRPVPFEAGADLQAVYEDSHVVIFRRHGALPRARLVHQCLPMPEGGPSAALREIRSGRIDPAATVLLEGVRPSPPAAPLPAGEEVLLARAGPERLEVRFRAGAPGWLVLSEAWLPGWRATLDGRPAAVRRAYGLMQAVSVPPGQHTLVLRYRPASAVWGLLLSAAGLACGAALAVWGLRRRRPGRPHTMHRMVLPEQRAGGKG